MASTGSRGPGGEPRQRILDAAAEVFAERGFGGAGVDEIARRAGVNKAMLYYHVGDKAALFGEVVSTNVATIAHAVTAALAATDDPRERLRAIPRAFARTVRQRPYLPQLMLREIAAGGPNLPPHAVEQIAEIMGMTRAVLEDGVARGTFRRVDPFIAHLLLIGALMFMANALRMRERFSSVLGLPSQRADELDALTDQMVDIALNGITTNEARGGN
jgi:TetR/AcrR family transcriptional regulator